MIKSQISNTLYNLFYVSINHINYNYNHMSETTILESIKLLSDWPKWLTTIQTGVIVLFNPNRMLNLYISFQPRFKF